MISQTCATGGGFCIINTWWRESACLHSPHVQAQLLGRGRALLLRGRVEAAKKAAQEVLQQAPEHADALCLLGQCFAAADDRLQVQASSPPQHDPAEQPALQSTPDAHSLAKLWCVNQQLCKMLCISVRRVHPAGAAPSRPLLHLVRVLCSLMTQSWTPQAFPTLMAAVARQPGHVQALTVLAALYKQAGLLQEASAALKAALDVAADDEALHAAQAAVLTDLGESFHPPCASSQWMLLLDDAAGGLLPASVVVMSALS